MQIASEQKEEAKQRQLRADQYKRECYMEKIREGQAR